MVKTINSIFKHSQLNGWNLLGWVSLLLTIIVIIPLSKIDTSNPAHISSMIAISVRTSVPWIFIAFSASSLVALLPNDLTKWIMRNRKIFGLCFAVGMAWQLFFILWFVFGSFDYYMREAYAFHSLVEQIPGYLVLFAMVITSFKWGRKSLTNKQWRILHKGGIYLLWGILFSTYWYELYFYTDTQPIEYVYYWAGITAWQIRIAAWSIKRSSHKQYKMASGEQSPLSVLNRMAALFFTIIGFSMIFSGEIWATMVMNFTSQLYMAEWLEHFMAFIPILPFYLAALAASTRQRVNLA